MNPLFILGGLFAAGAVIGYIFQEPKAPPSAPPAPPKLPTDSAIKQEELRRVMSYLGKRSGEVRGRR